jgi:hypothetical protein
MEAILLETMFDLPSLEGVEQVMISQQTGGVAADEASDNPRSSWKRRPAARASLLIWEQP